MNDIKVLFNKLDENAIIPTYGSPEAAGCDLYSVEEVVLEPNEIKLVRLGFSMEFEREMAALICPRSGLAIKEGITVINSPGVVDFDFRGEIKVGLINKSAEIKTVHVHDRIAQMLFVPVYRAHFLETATLSDTMRGINGFGSTGR